jgi:hypothetical protein
MSANKREFGFFRRTRNSLGINAKRGDHLLEADHSSRMADAIE